MSQAALKVKGRDSENSRSRPSNGSYLAGLIFFLMVLGIIIWGGGQFLTG